MRNKKKNNKSSANSAGPKASERDARLRRVEQKKKERINRQVNNVLGRDATPEELSTWAVTPSGVIRRHLATSDEARQRGVNPEDFGVKAIDPGTLKKRDREFYDVWRAYNPGGEFNTAVYDSLRWESSRGNVKVYEARQLGLIADSIQLTGNGSFRHTWVDPIAAEWAGGADQLTFYGHAKNQMIAGPAGMDLKFYRRDRNAEKKEGLDEEGVQVFGAVGKPRKALLQKIGIGEYIEKVVPNQLQFVADVFTPVGSVLIHQDWTQKGVKSMANTFGGKVSDWQTAQAVVSAVTDTVATVASGGMATPFVIGKKFAGAANQAYAYNTSLSDAFRQAAAQSAGVLVTSGLGGGEGLAGAFQNAGAAAAGTVTSHFLTPSEFQSKSLGRDLAWSAVGSLAGSAVRTGLGETPWVGDALKSNRWSEALAGAAADYGTQMGLGRLRYSTDDKYKAELDWNAANTGRSASSQLNRTALLDMTKSLLTSGILGGGQGLLGNPYRDDDGNITKSSVLGKFQNPMDNVKDQFEYLAKPWAKESLTVFRDYALRPAVFRFSSFGKTPVRPAPVPAAASAPAAIPRSEPIEPGAFSRDWSPGSLSLQNFGGTFEF